MKASDIAVASATVRPGDPVAVALRLMARTGLPGVIMVDEQDRPVRVIPGSQVLRLAVPDEFQRDAALVRAVDEVHADTFWAELELRTLGECLPEAPPRLGSVGCDATLLEVATIMARLHSPLLAVVDEQRRLVGAVTLTALMQRLEALHPDQ